MDTYVEKLTMVKTDITKELENAVYLFKNNKSPDPDNNTSMEKCKN